MHGISVLRRWVKAVSKKSKEKKKRNAQVICRNGAQFWTTQAQFWQWVREGIVVKLSDGPLTGAFKEADAEKLVVLSNTVLSLAHPIHLSEALAARRLGVGRR